MRAREVVGRKIIKVVQQKFCPRSHDSQVAVSLEEIHLDDGRIIFLTALESDNEPYVSARVYRPGTETPPDSAR